MKAVIDSAVQAITKTCALEPKVGLILGSGLGDYAQKLEHKHYVDYKSIPNFPLSTVQGHQGRFVLGRLYGTLVIAMQGRFHYYEGYRQEQLAIGVRTMHCLGVNSLILTNAAGGVNVDFYPGTFMLISDHINLSGANPLIGPNDDDFGPRFPDMSNVYDKALRERLLVLATKRGIALQQGVYAMMSGPSYETPAEIRMLRLLGASAVGMSTVPEAIVAAHCGMKVLGISLITNMAAGILNQPLSHEEVQQTAKFANEQFAQLIDLTLEQLF